MRSGIFARMDQTADNLRVVATIDKSVVADQSAFTQLLDKIESLPQTQVNLSPRLAKYGIISVITAPKMLDSIASLPGVKAVEADEIRRAL